MRNRSISRGGIWRASRLECTCLCELDGSPHQHGRTVAVTVTCGAVMPTCSEAILGIRYRVISEMREMCEVSLYCKN